MQFESEFRCFVRFAVLFVFGVLYKFNSPYFKLHPVNAAGTGGNTILWSRTVHFSLNQSHPAKGSHKGIGGWGGVSGGYWTLFRFELTACYHQDLGIFWGVWHFEKKYQKVTLPLSNHVLKNFKRHFLRHNAQKKIRIVIS